MVCSMRQKFIGNLTQKRYGEKLNYKTEQEKFWAGTFGDQYIERNNSDGFFVSKIAFWSRMLSAAHGVKTACELGCNIGLNLWRLKGFTMILSLRVTK